MQKHGAESTTNDGGWTKVEKRKAKKQRRMEVKLDVCVSSAYRHSSFCATYVGVRRRQRLVSTIARARSSSVRMQLGYM